MLAHQLDIVLPCYNPGKNWVATVIASLTYLQQCLPDTELFIYLVNDGSTTGITPTDIDQLRQSLKNFTYLAYTPNQGKGHALRTGVAAAGHQYCIYTDIDFPYYEKDFLQIYQALRSGQADLVAGVRDKAYYSNIPDVRSRVSKLFRFVLTKTIKLPLYDTQCGLKGFNQRGRELFLKTVTKRYLFDFEFILLAAKAHLSVSSVQVTLKPNITFGALSFRILATESISYLKLMLSKRKVPASG
ncbi:glycosyltransferase family 2 protein [Adhaeribacter rhizoryzae]|uniref:Glycosyltransferase family 2 protein n=1 Tax=Adhaeribacter rhizoryzae TaxID=2607907 RepID=A0A5M6DM70_9BACT|nr:glycosyltransferase family 2 protein [Adhaeribacter rhizoryzae]KAA5548621.1 glycosyltransferase family 2 protein [Adhaeribacter rhizoryzae]